MGLRHLRGSHHLLLRGGLHPEGDVVIDGVVEKHHALADHAEKPAQIGQSILVVGNPVDENLPETDVVEPRHQIHQRRFPAARGSHNRHGLPLAKGEADVPQDLASLRIRHLRVIGETDILERDTILKIRDMHRILHLLDLLVGIDDLIDPGRRAQPLAYLVVGGGQRLRRGYHAGEDHEVEQEERTVGRKALREGQQPDEGDGQCRENAEKLDQWRSQLLDSEYLLIQAIELEILFPKLLRDVLLRVVTLDDAQPIDRLLEVGRHPAEQPLRLQRVVADVLPDDGEDERHQRQDEERDERELRTDGEQRHEVGHHQEGVAAKRQQRGDDCPLHLQHVGAHAAHHIAGTLLCVEGERQADELAVKVVAKIGEDAGADVREPVHARIAGKVRQEGEQDHGAGDEEQRGGLPVTLDDRAHQIVERVDEILRRKGERRARDDGLHLVEKHLQERHQEGEREDGEKGVEQLHQKDEYNLQLVVLQILK